MPITIKKVKNVLKQAMILLMSMMITFMALMVISKVVMKNDVPRVAGISSFVISSGSMRGDVDEWSKQYDNHINPGDIVISRQTNNLKVGDIITFFVSEHEIITHRIIAIDSEGNLTTRGDANNVADKNSVNKVNVIGKVMFTIPKLGYASMHLRNAVTLLKTNILFDIGLIAIFSGIGALIVLAKKQKVRA